MKFQKYLIFNIWVCVTDSPWWNSPLFPYLLNFSSSSFVLLMNSPGDGWNKLSSVGFSKSIERIGLEIEMNFILESDPSPGTLGRV